MQIRDFSSEQLRVISNIAQQYDVLRQARQDLAAMPYHLKWHKSGGHEYLYEIRNARGDAKSLGPRTEETEAIKSAYDKRKQVIKERIVETEAVTSTTAIIWRSLKLPMISNEAARILQVLDTKRMLGESLLVVGTNAFAAYEIEAGGRFLIGWDATEDFDLAWTGKLVLGHLQIPQTLFGVLKEIDDTWTINTERTFQARNASAYEIELLSAPSVMSTLPPKDLRPLALKEQEWLLWGTPLEHVICSLAAKSIPARLAVPDPRWMALHKMWLSRQPKRRAEKRPKDARQGALLLSAVEQRMPRFPLDKEFESMIPDDLQSIYSEWKRVKEEFKN